MMILMEKYGPRMTIAQIADALSVSEKTVRNRIARREFPIPVYPDFGSTFADARDVAAYLDACRERAKIPA